MIADRTAQAFSKEHQELVKKSFIAEVIDSPVTYEGATVATLKVERPLPGSIKPSNPELLKDGQKVMAYIICVSFSQPGTCYRVNFEGEKATVQSNEKTVFEALKTIKFVK